MTFKLTVGEIEACATDPAILRALAANHEEIADTAETLGDEVRANYHITRFGELNWQADLLEREMTDQSDVPESTPITPPKGWKLVPEKITDAMIESAMEAHYGKTRVRAHGGARGIDMTVNDRFYNGYEAIRRMWKGALSATHNAPVV